MVALRKISQKLRANQTDAEKKLWAHLRAKQFHGLKFRRQEPIENYVVDFVCLSNKLILEVDGGQHSVEVDQERDDILQSKGFLVLRYWNNEVLNNIDGVLQDITNTIQPHALRPHPSPPLIGEGNKENKI